MNENEEITVGELTSNEYVRELEALKHLELGSKEYEAAVKGLVTLGKMSIDFYQQDIDANFEAAKHERDQKRLEIEEDKLNSERKQEAAKLKQGYCEIGAKVLIGVVVPLIAITAGGKNLVKVLKFEEFGTITSQGGRALMGKIFPKFL